MVTAGLGAIIWDPGAVSSSTAEDADEIAQTLESRFWGAYLKTRKAAPSESGRPFVNYSWRRLTFPRSFHNNLDVRGGSGKNKPAFGSRDGATEIFGGLDPFVDDDFDVGQGFAVGLPVSGATGKFGHFGDECLIFLAPVNDDFISRHLKSPVASSEL